MRILVRVAVTVSVAMAALAPSGPPLKASTPSNLQRPERSPLDIAKVDRKSTRLNSSHSDRSRMPSSA